MDRLPDSRDIEESVEKKNCISTFQGAKIPSKDAFSFMYFNYNSSFYFRHGAIKLKFAFIMASVA